MFRSSESVSQRCALSEWGGIFDMPVHVYILYHSYNNCECVCRCKAGFYGEDCEVDVNECLSNPCTNNGTCNNLAGRFACKCVPGYVGSTCDVNFDECASSPCQHRGTC